MKTKLLLGTLGSRESYGVVRGGKCCLTSLTIYDEMSSLLNEKQAVDLVYLDFSKAFDSTCCKIFVE